MFNYKEVNAFPCILKSYHVSYVWTILFLQFMRLTLTGLIIM